VTQDSVPEQVVVGAVIAENLADDHDIASNSDGESNNSNDAAREMQFQPRRSGRVVTPNRDKNYNYYWYPLCLRDTPHV
jgi:hypothetical protein